MANEQIFEPENPGYREVVVGSGGGYRLSVITDERLSWGPMKFLRMTGRLEDGRKIGIQHALSEGDIERLVTAVTD